MVAVNSSPLGILTCAESKHRSWVLRTNVGPLVQEPIIEILGKNREVFSIFIDN